MEVASVRGEELEIKDFPGGNTGRICRALDAFCILVALACFIPYYDLSFFIAISVNGRVIKESTRLNQIWKHAVLLECLVLTEP